MNYINYKLYKLYFSNCINTYCINIIVLILFTYNYFLFKIILIQKLIFCSKYYSK